MYPRKVQFETIFSLTSFPKQMVRNPVAMAYFLAYNNDMLMNLYSHGFQGPKYPVAKKM